MQNLINVFAIISVVLIILAIGAYFYENDKRVQRQYNNDIARDLESKSHSSHNNTYKNGNEYVTGQMEMIINGVSYIMTVVKFDKGEEYILLTSGDKMILLPRTKKIVTKPSRRK